jgi:hypothetical protein
MKTKARNGEAVDEALKYAMDEITNSDAKA